MDKKNNITQIIEYHISKTRRQKKDIAEAAGMQSGSFNRMLVNPTASTIERLAAALNMEPWELIKPHEEVNGQETSIVCPHCGKNIKLMVE